MQVPVSSQFGLCPRLSMTLQLAQLLERFKVILTGAVFIDVAKDFYSVWIEGLLYKLELPPYLMKFITFYLNSRTFVASFLASTSSCHLIVLERYSSAQFSSASLSTTFSRFPAAKKKKN